MFVGVGQFRPHILSFKKQANRIGVREILCIPKKLGERRTGTRSHNIERQALDIFHTSVANFWVQPKPVADFLQKCALLGCRLEQRDSRPVAQKLGQDQTGKTRPAAKIGDCFGVFGKETEKLGAVPDVPSPHIGERAWRNEVVATVPIFQESDISLQPGQCFTRNIGRRGKFLRTESSFML